jgi:hypothetical protein
MDAMVRTRVKQRKAGARAGQTVSGPGRDHKLSGDGRDTTEIEGYERRALRSVIDNEEASATARVQAARTLAELDGRLGRHQVAPSRSASEGLAILSRDELASELERLREVCELGLTHWSR